MFGDATPNLSIRVRNTLKEFWIALSDSTCKNLFTSASELLLLITLELSFVAKNEANDFVAPDALYSSINKSTIDLFVDLLNLIASFNELLNFSSSGLFARLRINSSKEISMVTFIPPLRSRPNGNSCALHSL